MALKRKGGSKTKTGAAKPTKVAKVHVDGVELNHPVVPVPTIVVSKPAEEKPKPADDGDEVKLADNIATEPTTDKKETRVKTSAEANTTFVDDKVKAVFATIAKFQGPNHEDNATEELGSVHVPVDGSSFWTGRRLRSGRSGTPVVRRSMRNLGPAAAAAARQVLAKKQEQEASWRALEAMERKVFKMEEGAVREVKKQKMKKKKATPKVKPQQKEKRKEAVTKVEGQNDKEEEDPPLSDAVEKQKRPRSARGARTSVSGARYNMRKFNI